MEKREIKPWQIAGVSFNTESKFWNFVRSALRQAWSRHEVKLKFVESFRIRVNNPNPNRRVETCWGMTCAKCKQDFPLPVESSVKKKIEEHTKVPFNYIEINHKTEAGSLKSKDDIGRFATNLLYVNFDDLEPICKECHNILSYSQKEGISIEEAIIQKKAIAIMKESSGKPWLLSKGVTPAGSAPKRREQIVSYLSGEDFGH